MKLREIRLKRRMTQAELAAEIGTTQQTIARWETGKAQPNAASLRDLSLALRTTTDSLLGRESFIANETTDPLAWLRGDSTGYWGNIGIRLAGKRHSAWYPITTDTMNRTYGAIEGAEPDDWVVFQTLNNKMVAFRPACAEKVTFLDEADDPVDGDWECGPADVEGLPLAFYECLAASVYDEPEQDQFSATLAADVAAFIKRHELSQQDIERMCTAVRVDFSGGNTLFLVPSDDVLVGAYGDFEDPLDPSAMLRLDDGLGSQDVFVSRNLISVIEFPLTRLKSALEEAFAEEE